MAVRGQSAVAGLAGGKDAALDTRGAQLHDGCFAVRMTGRVRVKGNQAMTCRQVLQKVCHVYQKCLILTPAKVLLARSHRFTPCGDPRRIYSLTKCAATAYERHP